MSVINLTPALREMFSKLDSRVRKLENSVVFRAPAVPTAPSNLTNGQIWYDTTQLKFETYDNGSVRPLGESKSYGSFYDTTNQTTSASNTATKVTFNSTDFLSNGITGGATGNIVVPLAGIWNFQFSLQATNTDTNIHNAYAWFRQNGTDIPYTNSLTAVPNSHGGTNGQQVIAFNIYALAAANDVFSLMWGADSTSVSLTTVTAPVGPVSPSAALTVGLAAW